MALMHGKGTITGFYGDQVLKELQAYHDHVMVVKLVQKWFVDAVDDFAPNSIDLPHIDGLHTYAAVKADFENYLPKMSRGVILFHDIAVHHQDFGVWAFWEEISARYPHFAFDQSYGLGVLAVGDSVPEAINWLCNLSEKKAKQVRRFFQLLGDNLTWETERLHVDAERMRLKHLTEMQEFRLYQSHHEIGIFLFSRTRSKQKFKQNYIERDEQIDRIYYKLAYVGFIIT